MSGLYVIECMTVASGIFAMLGVASHMSIAAMESFASTFHMPIVIPSAVESPSMSPPPSVTPFHQQASPSLPAQSTAAAQGHRRPAAAADQNYAIYVRPAYDHAVFSLIQRYNWKHFYYLYDTEQGRDLP